ncbi:hypothetical protein DIS24_g11373 [Lasiodiplodia hormozganensis]|uniref:Uncharacterized protein n=1 Tax=Lasiodiplodia hormozganensis TaxID=869390 RepID=A0AA40C1P9_9PEZI|nr:hypothetical protein DIS24_g11373 [Lasiodiplodia hormozganensis]
MPDSESAQLRHHRRSASTSSTDSDAQNLQAVPSSSSAPTVGGHEASVVPEGTHYHTLLPFSAQADTPDRDPDAPWRPPTPDRVMRSAEAITQLHTFQQLPAESQVRVIYLHQQEGMTVEEAVATAAVELRLRLLEQPVEARVAHTAAIRLTLAQVNENLFTHWILLNILVGGLPTHQQETGRRILRLVSADPRDVKGLYQARQEAARIGNGPINRALEDINDNAASFRRHDEELRGLGQYDRDRHLPEPEPIKDFPYGMNTPSDILKYDRSFDETTEAMDDAITDYCLILNQWLDGVCLNFAAEDDPVLQKLWEFFAKWSQGKHTLSETRKRQLLQFPFDKTAWDDPSTSDPGSILLGPFFKCALVRRGHPRLLHLSLLTDWKHWTMRKPGIVAMNASDDLNHMESAANEYLKGSRLTLSRELMAMGVTITNGLRTQLLQALKYGDIEHLDMLRLVNDVEIRSWPVQVQCRIYSIIMLSRATDKLHKLKLATKRVWQVIDYLDLFMDVPGKLPQPLFSVYARAKRQSYPVWHLSVFRHYYDESVQRLRTMVEACRNPRARKLMLEALPVSGHGANLERVRNIAVAAHVEKSIIKSADTLWRHLKDMQKVSERIRRLETQHLEWLSHFDIDQIEDMLVHQAQGSEFKPDDIEEVLNNNFHSHIDLSLLGYPDFGPGLRKALSETDAGDVFSPVDIARAFCAAALHRPLQQTIIGMRNHRLEIIEEGVSFAGDDVGRVSRLLLRAIYLSYVDHSITAFDRARCLSRHCWIVGLYGVWFDWHADVVPMLGKAFDALMADNEDHPEGSKAWGRPASRLVEAMSEEDKDWRKIEVLLAKERGDIVPASTKDELYEHFHKLRLLRFATDSFMRIPDVVDPRVLPADFCVAETTCGGDEFQMLHRIIKFDKSVMDGGVGTVDATGWEDAHDYFLREERLGHLCRAVRDNY